MILVLSWSRKLNMGARWDPVRVARGSLGASRTSLCLLWAPLVPVHHGHLRYGYHHHHYQSSSTLSVDMTIDQKTDYSLVSFSHILWGQEVTYCDGCTSCSSCWTTSCRTGREPWGPGAGFCCDCRDPIWGKTVWTFAFGKNVNTSEGEQLPPLGGLHKYAL